MSHPTITINQAQDKMKAWSKGDFTEELEAKWAGFGESVEPQLDLLLNRLINLTAEIGEGHVHFAFLEVGVWLARQLQVVYQQRRRTD